MSRAARTLTPVTLELGGKNPTVIDTMDDGFLAATVKEIVGTKAYFAGEFCQVSRCGSILSAASLLL